MTNEKKQIIVSKTKISKAPWEENRYMYEIDTKTGKDSLFDSNVYVFFIQIIVGIGVFIYMNFFYFD